MRTEKQIAHPHPALSLSGGGCTAKDSSLPVQGGGEGRGSHGVDSRPPSGAS
jgi:hypothetical protein